MSPIACCDSRSLGRNGSRSNILANLFRCYFVASLIVESHCGLKYTFVIPSIYQVVPVLRRGHLSPIL